MKNFNQKFEKLVALLFTFKPVKEYSDEIWHFHTPFSNRQSKWLVQSFTKYQNTIYWTIHFDMQLEFDLKTRVLKISEHSQPREAYDVATVIQSCIQTLTQAKKDWVGYHRQLLRRLPKPYRFGLIHRRILWSIWQDIYRPDLEWTTKQRRGLENIFHRQEGPTEIALVEPLRLNTYLEYCRVAYLANFKKYKSDITREMTGMEMYQAMADGRHEGLVKIDPNSADAFQSWYDSGRGGGHPWEICRGGNTTHINLGVLKENDRWFIFLEGNSTSRMLETARMALAFREKKMPFRWLRAADVQLKMEGRDNIGIIPEHHSLHRANQLFDEKDHVFDCIHWNDLERHKKAARDFVTWLPLDPLYPLKA